MASELLLIGNPARRRRSAKRRAPSPAQKRARAKFAAMARGRTRSNPVARVTRSRRRVRRNPATRGVRRNPIRGGVLRGLGPMLKSAAYGAAGAVAVDISYGFALPYLPSMVQSPASPTGINPAYYLGKGAFTVALGVLGKRVLGPKAGPMVEGALTVLMHDAAKQFIGASGMGVPMGYMPGGRSLRMYTGGEGRTSMLPDNFRTNPQLGMYPASGSRMQARENVGTR